jgi:hypothetical protein
MFTEGAIQFFNLFYTSLPIIILGVYDTDLAREFVYRNPRLYQAGVKNQYFNVSETSLPSLPLSPVPTAADLLVANPERGIGCCGHHLPAHLPAHGLLPPWGR